MGQYLTSQHCLYILKVSFSTKYQVTFISVTAIFGHTLFYRDADFDITCSLRVPPDSHPKCTMTSSSSKIVLTSQTLLLLSRHQMSVWCTVVNRTYSLPYNNKPTNGESTLNTRHSYRKGLAKKHRLTPPCFRCGVWSVDEFKYFVFCCACSCCSFLASISCLNFCCSCCCLSFLWCLGSSSGSDEDRSPTVAADLTHRTADFAHVHLQFFTLMWVFRCSLILKDA